MPDRRQPRALLCDMDDTVLDSSGARDECLRRVCTETAGRNPPVDPAALCAAIDRAANWYWSDEARHLLGRMDLDAAFRGIMQTALAQLGVHDSARAREISDRYRSLREDRYRVFPGALDVLGDLRRRGVHLALVTNGAARDQRKKIERFGLAPYFDSIVIEGELGVGKPDPRVYECALESVNCTPRDAWMVGDNLEWDVFGPQRLGVYGIWVDRHGRGLPQACPNRPDRIIRSITELL